jgi:DNA-binding SARP family transcriptional activator
VTPDGEAAGLEFGLLGAFQVTAGGLVLPIGSTKQRVLLAMLVLELNRLVSADRLMDELWGASPPVTAMGTLQSLVSRLRRVLADTAGPAPDAVAKRGSATSPSP